MEWICVPNITAVKVRKRMASRQRKIRSSTDTPGEKSLHSGDRRRKKKSDTEQIKCQTATEL